MATQLTPKQQKAFVLKVHTFLGSSKKTHKDAASVTRIEHFLKSFGAAGLPAPPSEVDRKKMPLQDFWTAYRHWTKNAIKGRLLKDRTRYLSDSYDSASGLGDDSFASYIVKQTPCSNDAAFWVLGEHVQMPLLLQGIKDSIVSDGKKKGKYLWSTARKDRSKFATKKDVLVVHAFQQLSVIGRQMVKTKEKTRITDQYVRYCQLLVKFSDSLQAGSHGLDTMDLAALQEYAADATDAVALEKVRIAKIKRKARAESAKIFAEWSVMAKEKKFKKMAILSISEFLVLTESEERLQDFEKVLKEVDMQKEHEAVTWALYKLCA